MSNTKSKLAPAPAINSGDAIELTPLLGKVVAIRCDTRREVSTSFGVRNMTGVTMLVDGEAEPLIGVLFQSYFQRLTIGEWFLGVVIKSDRSWGLDASNVNKSAVARLSKAVDAVPDAPALPF